MRPCMGLAGWAWNRESLFSQNVILFFAPDLQRAYEDEIKPTIPHITRANQLNQTLPYVSRPIPATAFFFKFDAEVDAEWGWGEQY